MLDFKYPEPKDREWLSPILSHTGHMGSEYAFGTLFIWRDTYHSKVCRAGEETYFCFGAPLHVYKSPVANDGNFYGMIETMVSDAKEKEIPFRMWGVSAEDRSRLEQRFPGRFRFELDRDGSDYIYRTEDLILLAGRKYHGKRNHIAQFQKKYSWSYEDVDAHNLEDCRVVARQWCLTHGCRDSSGFESEPCALSRAMEHFGDLQLGGGLIRVGGIPVAFTIGEEINPRAYLLHFEKALDGYDGLYAVINHEFAKRHLGDYEFVNREEDMGIEGLRKAKLSYHPALLLEKYIMTLTEENGGAE